MKCKWKDCDNNVTGKAQYCSGACRVKQSRSVTPTVTLKEGMDGYLYLVRCVGFPYYKIGITTCNPLTRLGGIQTGCPFKVEIEWAIQVSGIKGEEKGLHECYSDKHVRGEWYNLTGEDIECIKLSYLAVYETVADVRECAA